MKTTWVGLISPFPKYFKNDRVSPFFSFSFFYSISRRLQFIIFVVFADDLTKMRRVVVVVAVVFIFSTTYKDTSPAPLYISPRFIASLLSPCRFIIQNKSLFSGSKEDGKPHLTRSN